MITYGFSFFHKEVTNELYTEQHRNYCCGVVLPINQSERKNEYVRYKRCSSVHSLVLRTRGLGRAPYSRILTLRDCRLQEQRSQEPALQAPRSQRLQRHPRRRPRASYSAAGDSRPYPWSLRSVLRRPYRCSCCW